MLQLIHLQLFLNLMTTRLLIIYTYSCSCRNVITGYLCSCGPTLRMDEKTAFLNTKVFGVESYPPSAVTQPLVAPMPNDNVIPVVNSGALGIGRCRRGQSCTKYTLMYLECGQTWRCSLCFLSSVSPRD